MNKTRCTLAFLAIFLIGAVAGAAGGLAFARNYVLRSPNPETIAAHIRAKLQKGLRLTPQQVEKINPLLLRRGVNLQTLHQDVLERVVKILDESNAEIAAELTPEQRVKFENSQRDRHRWLRSHGGPPSGG